MAWCAWSSDSVWVIRSCSDWCCFCRCPVFSCLSQAFCIATKVFFAAKELLRWPVLWLGFRCSVVACLLRLTAKSDWNLQYLCFCAYLRIETAFQSYSKSYGLRPHFQWFLIVLSKMAHGENRSHCRPIAAVNKSRETLFGLSPARAH